MIKNISLGRLAGSSDAPFVEVSKLMNLKKNRDRKTEISFSVDAPPHGFIRLLWYRNEKSL